MTGNIKCVYCGYIDDCPMSALPRLFNGDKSCVPLNYNRVEDQKETWERARVLGQEIATRLEKRPKLKRLKTGECRENCRP